MSNVLVCPVAFNENVKLRNVIERFLKSGVRSRVDYLVVDDASDDGTTEVIQDFSPQGVKTIKHERRQGVGAAIRTAIHYARKQRYEVLVIMAGNNKDNPDEIPCLIDLIINEGYDFVQGSRYKGHEGIGGDMPLYRKAATKIHPWLMSLITKRKVTDSTNGFRALRLSIFDHQEINIDQPWLDHYEIEPYLLYKAITLGFKFSEASVTKIYPSRKVGYTKMRPLIGWWSILRPLVYLGLGIKK
ncbi:MAG: glycosyltransferase family 2 protein [Candidatus Omnitrophica bacterium]|nr:glycosyltransferase family 2 protein [Candidatus Omnitrophota bacterium]MCK5259979.1 glycosyltransferase family 2 protein [Candidatus Omnitrophota bacterium]